MKKITDDLIKEIQVEAKRIKAEDKMVKLRWEDYQEYLQTGDRMRFQEKYFARRKQLMVMGLAVYLNPTEENILMLEKVIKDICREYTWALPAHLDIVEGIFAKNSPWQIDLFAAETGQTLCEIKSIAKEYLSEEVKEEIAKEVEQRIFTPFEDGKWDWEEKENNWSAVIAGCIGMGILDSTEMRKERQERMLERLSRAFTNYLKSFEEDGACVEGVGYWGYGFGYYCYFAEKYHQIYESKKYLQNEKLAKIAAFPYLAQVGKDILLPFSDMGEDKLPSGLLSFCSRYFNVKVPAIERVSSLNDDHCFRWAPLWRSLIWTEEKKEVKENLYHHFENAQWLHINNKKQAFVFAAKGGTNYESHNHCDLGHFIIGTQDELILTDLGAGEYTKNYFDDAFRYEILNNRSLGHSVPLINGYEQGHGEVYRANQMIFKKVEEKVKARLNLKEAYPHSAAKLKDFVRKWEIADREEVVILEDSIDFINMRGNQVQQNFISRWRPKVQKEAVCWQGEKAFVVLQGIQKEDEVNVCEERVKRHDGKEEVVFRLEIKTSEIKERYERKYIFIKGNGEHKDEK
jgi:Heparinase II/III-like protein.